MVQTYRVERNEDYRYRYFLAMFKKVHTLRSKWRSKSKKSKKKNASQGEPSDSSSFREEMSGNTSEITGTCGDQVGYEAKLRKMREELETKYGDQIEGIKTREATHALRVNTKLAWVTKQRDENEARLQLMEKKYKNLKKKLTALEESSSNSGVEAGPNEIGSSRKKAGKVGKYRKDSNNREPAILDTDSGFEYLKTWCKQTDSVLSEIQRNMTHIASELMTHENVEKLSFPKTNCPNIEEKLRVDLHGNSESSEIKEKNTELSILGESTKTGSNDEKTEKLQVCAGQEKGRKEMKCSEKEFTEKNAESTKTGSGDEKPISASQSEAEAIPHPDPSSSDRAEVDAELLNESTHAQMCSDFHENSTVDLNSGVSDERMPSRLDSEQSCSQTPARAEGHQTGTLVDMQDLVAQMTRQFEMSLMQCLVSAGSEPSPSKVPKNNIGDNDTVDNLPGNMTHELCKHTEITNSDNEVWSEHLPKCHHTGNNIIYDSANVSRTVEDSHVTQCSDHASDSTNHVMNCRNHVMDCRNDGTHPTNHVKYSLNHVTPCANHVCNDHVLRHVVQSSAIIANLRDLKPCEQRSK